MIGSYQYHYFVPDRLFWSAVVAGAAGGLAKQVAEFFIKRRNGSEEVSDDRERSAVADPDHTGQEAGPVAGGDQEQPVVPDPQDAGRDEGVRPE